MCESSILLDVFQQKTFLKSKLYFLFQIEIILK